MEKEKEFNKIKQLINFDFEEITIPPLNCFNSNDLDVLTRINILFNRNLNETKKLLMNLVSIEKEEKITQLDLTRIDSISSSKSKSSGYVFNNVYDFGKYLVLKNKHAWTLDECKRHIGEKLKNDIYELNYYKWNDRYEWGNIDGSHHFAVANFIVTNQNLEYKINCVVKNYSLNIENIKDLTNNFYIFIIRKNLPYLLMDMFDRNEIKMCDAWHDSCVFLINKINSRKNLINLLKIIDRKYVFNLGEYLINLIK